MLTSIHIFGANWWLFGWSADALIALLPGFTYIYTYSLKPVAQMYSVAPWVFRCISWKWYEVSKCFKNNMAVTVLTLYEFKMFSQGL